MPPSVRASVAGQCCSTWWTSSAYLWSACFNRRPTTAPVHSLSVTTGSPGRGTNFIARKKFRRQQLTSNPFFVEYLVSFICGEDSRTHTTCHVPPHLEQQLGTGITTLCGGYGSHSFRPNWRPLLLLLWCMERSVSVGLRVNVSRPESSCDANTSGMLLYTRSILLLEHQQHVCTYCIIVAAVWAKYRRWGTWRNLI